MNRHPAQHLAAGLDPGISIRIQPLFMSCSSNAHYLFINQLPCMAAGSRTSIRPGSKSPDLHPAGRWSWQPNYHPAWQLAAGLASSPAASGKIGGVPGSWQPAATRTSGLVAASWAATRLATFVFLLASWQSYPVG